MRDTCTHHFEPKKIDRVDRGGQGRSEKGAIRGNLGVILGEVCMANFSRNSASDWMKIFKMRRHLFKLSVIKRTCQ